MPKSLSSITSTLDKYSSALCVASLCLSGVFVGIKVVSLITTILWIGFYQFSPRYLRKIKIDRIYSLLFLAFIFSYSIQFQFLNPQSWNVSSYFLLPGFGFILSSFRFKGINLVYIFIIIIASLFLYVFVDAFVLVGAYIVGFVVFLLLQVYLIVISIIAKSSFSIHLDKKIDQFAKHKYPVRPLMILLISILLVFIPIILISRFDFIRITGARELIWVGYLEHVNILYRPIISSALVDPARIADILGTPHSYLNYQLGNYLNTFRYNPHSMFVATIGKYGYLFGVSSLYLFLSYIRRLFLEISCTNYQRLFLFVLWALALLNGKGFYTTDGFTVFFNLSLMMLLFCCTTRSA